jgi:two-component system alkaline phosphatase synthesis response regulator PhoP
MNAGDALVAAIAGSGAGFQSALAQEAGQEACATKIRIRHGWAFQAGRPGASRRPRAIFPRCHLAATGTLQTRGILRAMPPTILTVDDEPDVLELIRFHLTNAGCEVLTATSGRVALETIRARRPDLVLLDLMLPDIDGFGVCEILRRQPATATLPIIIVSAWSTLDSRNLGLELGALDYLTKPFSPKTLVGRVKRLLSLRPADQKTSPGGITSGT